MRNLSPDFGLSISSTFFGRRVTSRGSRCTDGPWTWSPRHWLPSLLLRDTHRNSFNRSYRKLARLNYAIAGFFLNRGPRTDASEILRLIWGGPISVRAHETANAWNRARMAFQEQLLLIGVCPESLWHIWESAHAHLDASDRVRAGSPGRFTLRVVNDDATATAIESALQPGQVRPKRIADWFLGTLTRRPSRSCTDTLRRNDRSFETWWRTM
jgi:hypothetical protein